MVDWGPGFCGEEVVEWELGGGDYAEAFGEVEVVYEGRQRTSINSKRYARASDEQA